MFKITRTESQGRGAWLHLEGRITQQELPALEQAVRDELSGDGLVVVDLSALRFADRSGIALLRSLPRDRVVLTNPSPLVSELLQEVSE